MKRIVSLLLIVAFPAFVLASNYSNAPLIAVGDGSVMTRQKSPAVAPATHNETLHTTPVAPNALQDPKQESPATPPAPETTDSPISRLWPRDTVPIFVTSCSHLNPQAMAPCRCIITEVMASMMHDEFMRLSDAKLIESDSRYLAARERCIPQSTQQKR
jgi:hypothetical protein